MSNRLASQPAPLAMLVAAVAVFWTAGWPGLAYAEEPIPLVVVTTPRDAAGKAAPAVRALRRYASEQGTAVVDLTPAPEPASQAATHLARGIGAYHAFNYKDALDHIEAGIAEAVRTGGRDLSPSQLSDLAIYRALALTELGDSVRAWDDFVRAAVLDPSRLLDAARFPPRATEPFSRAVAQVTAGSHGELTIELAGKTPGALSRSCRIYLDGRLVAAGEAQSAPWGEHYLSVNCPDHEPYGARVLLRGPSRVVRPALRARAQPTLNHALSAAHKQGARSLLWAVVTVPDGRTPVLSLQLVDPASGKERRRATVRVAPASEADIAAAAVRLVGPQELTAPARPPAPPRPSAWYRSPWLWGAVGVAVGAAIVLPFVLDAEPKNQFDIELGGELPQ